MTTRYVNMVQFPATPESPAYPDIIGNQITATNEIGRQHCWVLADGAADAGIRSGFRVPSNYVGTGVVKAHGVLDGAMSTVTLGVGIQGLAGTDNAAADTAYGTADLGSNAVDHADEDFIDVSITLSNLTLTAGGIVYFRHFLDVSVTTYTGNFLMTGLTLEYSDA